MSTGISIASSVASDRSVPEDAVRVIRTGDFVAFVVADGAGGLGGGARAAQLVVKNFEDEIRKLPVGGTTAEMWCDFLLLLDSRIERDSIAGESTALVAMLDEKQVVGASVGDSELWTVARDGSREVLTSGQHKSRLGSGRAKPVGFRAALANSVIIAATDGLFHNAPADAICAVLCADPTPEKLVTLVRSRSGRLYDDVGLVVVSVVLPAGRGA